MRNVKFLAACLLWAVSQSAWAPQRPGLSRSEASEGEIVRQAPGFGSGSADVDALRAENERLRQRVELLQKQAPGAGAGDGQMGVLQADNAKLKRRVELLQRKVDLLEERLRTLEGSQ